MDTDQEGGGTTEGTTPVRTDCVSGAVVAPDTCICVGGAAGLELVGAAEGVGFVSDVFACISPRLMRSRIKRWYPSLSKLSNCSNYGISHVHDQSGWVDVHPLSQSCAHNHQFAHQDCHCNLR